MSDFSALWHSCSLLSVKSPPRDLTLQTIWRRRRGADEARALPVCHFHYPRYLRLTFKIVSLKTYFLDGISSEHVLWVFFVFIGIFMASHPWHVNVSFSSAYLLRGH